MHLIPLVSAALVLTISGPAFAQEWKEYVSKQDLFSVSFQGEPTVRDITYQSEYRDRPARARLHTPERPEPLYRHRGRLQERHQTT